MRKKRKVTEEEVARLYHFTRQHYVEFYDLQTELVDHLANAIEEEWEKDSTRSFEENLETEFRKFGVLGFSDVVEKRQRALEKKYFKLLWKELGVLLKQPFILVFLIVIFFGSKYALLSEEGYRLLTFGIMFLCIFQIFLVLRLEFKHRKRKKTSKRVYLLEEIILKAGGLSIGLLLPLYLVNSLSAAELAGNLVAQTGLSFLITAVALVSYIALCQLPRKKSTILKKAYPEIEYLS